MEEQVIWVDENDRELGRVARKVAHDPKKLLVHRETMELIYVNKEHTKFWLQKRSEKKEQYPGYWTMSVTCHVNPEDITATDHLGYLTAGVREGMEEMGVIVINQKLMGVNLVETKVNRAMMGIVVAEGEGEVKIDTEEVEEARVFDRDTIAEVGDKLTPGAKACLKYLGIIN